MGPAGGGAPIFLPGPAPDSTCLVVIAGKQAAFDQRLDLLPVAQFQNNVLLQMAGVGGVGGRGAGAAPGAGAGEPLAEATQRTQCLRSCQRGVRTGRRHPPEGCTARSTGRARTGATGARRRRGSRAGWAPGGGAQQAGPGGAAAPFWPLQVGM